MTTSYAEEREVQTAWDRRSVRPDATWPEQLLAAEFLDPRQLQTAQQHALARMLRHAAVQVPWYRRIFSRIGLNASDLGDANVLLRLPILTREELQAHAGDLRAHALPAGDRHAGSTRSSGTTGQPVEVQHSLYSKIQFSRLKQREARWLRLDPDALLSAIRPRVELPRKPDGAYMGAGDLVQGHSWPWAIGQFQTGGYCAITNSNPPADQVRFLRQSGAGYLIAPAANLEQVALTAGGKAVPGLRACLAISQALTLPMRASVERAFGVPVHQNYGLNEIGLVATRCVEGGRYHVHAEHCLVEIVDHSGRPCAPGEQGRLLVTTLTNTAMPLIRYDADDLAVAVDGDCPCGRSLPAFAAVVGRYRRLVGLPPGTWDRWGAIQMALYKLPADLTGTVRRYQAQQYADGSWVLRMDAEAQCLDALTAHVRHGFESAAIDPPPLRIERTDRFEGDPHGKFQNFLSVFMLAPDQSADPR